MKGLAGTLKLAAAVLVFAACAAQARADVKIKVRQTMAGHAGEQTTYIKGKRQRTEMMGGQMVAVQQCDLRRDLQINGANRTYTVTRYAQDAAARPNAAAAQTRPPAGAAARGGLVTTTVTNKDTGERKQMFGHTARRVLTTMVTESSPDSCTPVKTRMEIDGWYIDAAFALDCDSARDYTSYTQAADAGCRDRHQMKQVGAARTGYPVSTKTTMYDEAGHPAHTMLYEVVEISQATLDASLFDAPAGYREVKSAAELYGAGGSGVETEDGEDGEDDAEAEEPGEPRLAAKREGVVRLGIAAVRTGAVGDGLSAAELAEAVRGELASQLRGPGVEVVAIEARLPEQIEAEAGEKDCDFVVYASVSHRKGGGGLGRIFGGAASAIGGATVGAAGTRTSYAASSSAPDTSAGVRSRDELTLDLRLESPGGAAPTVTRQFKAKARSNGDDIVSPVVGQAAQAIMDAAAAAN